MNIDRNRLHLLHIRDAIEKVEIYTKDLTYAEFAKRDLAFDAITLQMIVIGEAVHELSDEFKEKHNTLPWHLPVGLRNRIAHGYADVKPEIIWQTIQNDLPKLKEQVESIV